MKISILCALGFLVCGNATAAFYTVTGTADNTDSATHGGSGTVGSPFLMSSLRGAILNANSSASATATISVPVGTYPLSVNNPASGTFGTIAQPDLEIGSHVLRTVIITGTGGRAKIQQTIALNDVITTGFDTDDVTPVAVNLTLQNLEITGGQFTGIFSGADNATGRASTTITNCFIHDNSNADATYGQGGAIFNQTGSLTIQSCIFSNNIASNAAVGQGGVIFYNLPNASGLGSIGDLTVVNCSFINNKSAINSGFPAGGAMFIAVVSAGNPIIVSNCIFAGNQGTGGGDGGAIAMVDNARVLNLSACTFSNNAVTSAAGHGGVIDAHSGTLNVNYCRFIGNTASAVANGKAIYRNTATVNANDNWWTVNTGPAANDVVGTVTLGSWLQLRHAANPNSIVVPNSTTLTATFLTNSAGTFIPAANLTALVGVPITFNNPVRGALSGAQTTVQVSGTATATFTANAGGAGSADAVVDNQTVTAPITVSVVPAITCPADITTNAAGYCVPSIAFASTVTTGFPAPVVTYKLGASVITSPFAFPIGTNTVTSTATNVVGTNSCTFNVTVVAGAAPQLSIVRNSTNVIVSWTNSFPCYALQFAPVLASNSWSLYPGPFATNNGKIFVTNSAPFTNRFFRLKF